MPPFEDLTLAETAQALRARQISSQELTRAALDAARDAQPRLNAFIEIEEDLALTAARAADEAMARGCANGRLHGIPLAHKDMYDRAGKITGCGSKIRANHIAASTSTVMARLELAGALSIGRLNMSEFALGPTGHNAHHGRACNPLDPRRLTGGSSSGSGAAVGSGIVKAALGSDTGGSIRLPAACCGTVGIKPTQGRVSRFGAMPLSASQDCVGPLAQGVEDAYAVLQIIAGPDGKDPTCRDVAALPDLTDDISGLRIGILQGPFAEDLELAVECAVDSAARSLACPSGGVRSAPCPDFNDLPELANIVAMAEAAMVHFDWLASRPEDYGPQPRARISQAMAIPAPVYLRALQRRGLMLQAFLATAFADADVLIAPTMPFLPPLAEEFDAGDSPRMAEVIGRMTVLTRPFSFLGLPVVTVPVALATNGLPIALQVVARPWREDLAAAVAAALERAASLPPIYRRTADGTSPLATQKLAETTP